MVITDEVHSGDTQPSKKSSNKGNENDPKKRDEVKPCNGKDAQQHLLRLPPELSQNQSFQDQHSMHSNQFPPSIQNMNNTHNYYPSTAVVPYIVVPCIVLPTYPVFPTCVYEQMVHCPEYYEQTPPEYYAQTAEQVALEQVLFDRNGFQYRLDGSCMSYNIPLSPPFLQSGYSAYHQQQGFGGNEVGVTYPCSSPSSRRCRRRTRRRQRKRKN